MTVIVLPFPPAGLSGHAKGHWRTKAALTKKHREWARLATVAAGLRVHEQGDIHIRVAFTPPDRKSDRANFANRVKPYFDGIAEALGVNDRRFHPAYVYGEPEKPGRVEFTLSAVPWTAEAEAHLAAAQRYVENAA